MIDCSETDRTLTQTVGGIHGDRIDADAHRHVGRSVLGIAHVHARHGHPGHLAGRGRVLGRSRVVHAGHRAMIHTGHVGHRAVIHSAHAHVAHGEVRDLSQGRDLGGHAQARRQGRPAHAGPVDGFGDDGVGAVLGRLDDDVVGLGDRNLELVRLDRAHVLAVGLHHGHRQARDANVEDGHGRRVDDAQPHPLAGPEQAGPVLLRSMAVDQIGVGRPADVEDVARVHPHLAPHAPFLQAHAVAAVHEPRQRGALLVEVTRALLQLGQDFVRMHETPVRQDQHMLAVVGDRIGARRVDHDWAVVTHRLL